MNGRSLIACLALGSFVALTTHEARAEPATSQAAAGAAHTCAKKADGTLWCWGQNTQGELGDTTTTPRPLAVPVTTLGSAVKEVSAHENRTCALKTDGTLWCWGNNDHGALGNGTTSPSSTPVWISALGNVVVDVSLGSFHTCALKADHTVWCWGWNLVGQIGDGTHFDRLLPVEVTDLAGTAVEISSGDYHSCARKLDGTAWCWGYNILGQLGDGTTDDRTAPSRMRNVSNLVVELSAGGQHTCARITDGTLYCTGDNRQGQLGYGGPTSLHFPEPIMTGMSQVSAGGEHTCALRSGVELWCWGRRDHGQFGDGTAGPKQTTPLRVTSPFVSELVTGRLHTCTRRPGGTLYCAGLNDGGQLGDGTTTDRPSPVLALSGLVFELGGAVPAAPRTLLIALALGLAFAAGRRRRPRSEARR